jgi:2-polyprenyl-3-methyl-5-hydroxy-6-metoxy-1,4-benzoquinol methylase
MAQQDQAKSYFDAWAGDWQAKAEGRVSEFNLIEARNNAVLDVINSKGAITDFLDVGCGTGQLAIDVAKKGFRSRGIDFAPEMIRISEANNNKESANATFVCASFFEVDLPHSTYDVISALGFIEYISLDQLEVFLKGCSAALRPGGSLALGSRNRIFNVVSLNAFTQMELELGTLDRLAAEGITLQTSRREELFSRLAAHERIDPQPESHPMTGVGVDLRYQFSPAELIMRGRRYGLTPSAIYPSHFHGLPTAFKNENPQIHADLAVAVGKFAALDHRFVPYCSTFVIELRKSS